MLLKILNLQAQVHEKSTSSNPKLHEKPTSNHKPTRPVLFHMLNLGLQIPSASKADLLYPFGC